MADVQEPWSAVEVTFTGTQGEKDVYLEHIAVYIGQRSTGQINMLTSRLSLLWVSEEETGHNT